MDEIGECAKPKFNLPKFPLHKTTSRIKRENDCFKEPVDEVNKKDNRLFVMTNSVITANTSQISGIYIYKYLIKINKKSTPNSSTFELKNF